MSSTRPEWIRCIEHTHAQKLGTSWCGRLLLAFEVPFQGIDHAAYATLNGDRLVVCSECAAAVVSLLRMDVPF